MTYRDDHDAALQRIEALKVELERAEAERDKATGERDRAAGERDRAAGERDKLADELAHTQQPPQQIVIVPKAPLTAPERRELVSELELGALRNRGRAWFAATISSLMLIAAMVTGLMGKLAIAAPLAFSALIYSGLSLSMMWKTSADRWRPVVAAVRDAPEKIIAVRRLAGKYRWWLVVETRTGELHMRGDASVMKLLERHCPGARFDG